MNRYNHMNRSLCDVDHDGITHDESRDSPGQRSLYIPPGDAARETYRLSTYMKFPQVAPVNPRDLASAGFFYTGYKDRVKCFSCGLCVEEWAVGDDVRSSRWHKPDCLFVKGEECGNMPIGHLFQNTLATTTQVNYLSNIVSPQHKEFVRALDLRKVVDRLKSFRYWPLPNLYPKDLAQSGFFYLGNLGRVQCFSCGGVLRIWAASDTHGMKQGKELLDESVPSTSNGIHARHFPHCRMVLGTENRNVSNLPTVQNSLPETMQGHLQINLLEKFELQKTFPCNHPVNPHMRSEDTRFETFDQRWPSSRVHATPRQIARAGFFFLGERDRVKCWYCNGGLQNWDPDDEPWFEHAKWFPTCEFLLQQRGPDFVHRIVSKFPNLTRPHIRARFHIPFDTNDDSEHGIKQGKQLLDESVPSTSNGITGSQGLPHNWENRVSSNNVTKRTQNMGSRLADASLPMKRVRNASNNSNATRPQISTLEISSFQHVLLINSLDLKKEADRIKTFESWSNESRSVNSNDLAQSGFFYLGNLDRVQCFSCEGILKNWKSGDNVDHVHRQYFPHCRMVLGTEDRNVALPIDTQNSFPNVSEENSQVSQQQNETVETEQQTLFPCLDPVNPHMRSEDTRFETFDQRWPSSRVHATPRQIARAGFFFLGERDRVKCWYCNGGLHTLGNDDPWFEHAKWFPTCEFILQQNGLDYVEEITARFQNLQRPNLLEPLDLLSSSRQSSPLPPFVDYAEEVRILHKKIERFMESNVVKTAMKMGFDYLDIRRTLKKRFEIGREMYQSVDDLIEDLTSLSNEFNSDDSEDGSTSQSHTTISTPSTSNSSGMDAQDLKIRKLEEHRCKICLDAAIDVVFLPCGHLCSCANCAKSLRKCPICRVKITQVVRTYAA